MRSAGHDLRGALAALVLLSAMGHVPVLAADLTDGIRELFEQGSTTSPSAIRAAKAHYDKLKAASKGDPRIDYAYGVVLLNQHRYREAGELLAAYLAEDEAEVSAYCLYIGALVPRNEYGKALEQAELLARRLADEAGGASDEDRHDAAAFLGTLFRYLELPRKGTLDARLLARSKQNVLDSLDAPCNNKFAQGYNAVARLVSELQAEQQLVAERRTDKVTYGKEIDERAVEDAEEAIRDAAEKSRQIEQELRDVRQQYADLQKQMSPFVSQARAIETTIVIRQTQLQQGMNDGMPGAVIVGMQNEILLLQQQLNDLARRLGVLRTSAAALEVQAAEHRAALASAESAARKGERQRIQAQGRIERAWSGLAGRQPAAKGKLTSFATYAPLSYELEQKRVLDWFSARDGNALTWEAH